MIPILIAGGGIAARDLRLDKHLEGKKLLEQLDGAEGSLKLDIVRNLLTHLSLKFLPEDRVALVIREAQALTAASQNVLLKSLEELPEQVSFYLTADGIESLLPTVVSRCRVETLPRERVNLSPEREADMIQLFKLIRERKVGQLLKWADTWTKGDAKQRLLELQEFLLSRSRVHPNPQRAMALKLVLECLDASGGQQNRQLALEHLFLELVELSAKN